MRKSGTVCETANKGSGTVGYRRLLYLHKRNDCAFPGIRHFASTKQKALAIVVLPMASKIGFSDAEQNEFSRALHQQLLVQTPLQVDAAGR